jgi:hypothetical protein
VSDTARMVVIALGMALLVLVLVPVLFMSGMMGMMGGMMGGGPCCAGMSWSLLGFAAVIALVAAALLAMGLRRP